MQKILIRFVAMFLSLISLAASAATELQSYVQQCETELGFNASDVQPMNCNDGVNFVNGNVVNDYLVYQRINDKVDLTTACRWMDNPTGGRAVGAVSVELIIHNRSNAETCFFAAKDGSNNDAAHPVSVAVISPTYFGSHPNANDYWLQPTDLNNKVLTSDRNGTDPVQCVGCHSAGPYIASPNIVPYLAQFGLLNNGHDTVADATNPNNPSKIYHAVGSGRYNKPLTVGAFGGWDSIIYNNLHGYSSLLNGNADPQNECSTGCHSVAYASTIGTLSPGTTNVSLLVSISQDLNEILTGRLMPPTNDPNSNYRWINLDTPNGSGDWELLRDAQNQYPRLVCDSPTELQAHVVGSNYIFSTADQIPDKLHNFNLQDGLMCLNSEQSSGLCHDYQVRYVCNGAWTGWINNDTPNGNGDYERRFDPGYANLCSSPAAIQAKTTVVVQVPTGLGGSIPVKQTVSFFGPNDRLFEFDPLHGLGCQNADQPDGACANYVVRFICK